MVRAVDVLVVGGTGLIGRQLARTLRTYNYSVGILSRQSLSADGLQYFKWDPSRAEIDTGALNARIIVNLAGANIASGRWTSKRKALLFSSRVNSTAFLFEAMRGRQINPELYIGASAVGYYGHRHDDRLTEESPAGQGFLSSLCQAWEEQHRQFEDVCHRSAVLRFGVVLSTQGGALPKMAAGLQWGAAPHFGNGRQFIPWIHVLDACEAIRHIIDDPAAVGPFNITSPDPERIEPFIHTLRKICARRAWQFGIPAVLLRIGLGEMASTVLDSSRAVPRALLSRDFAFRYGDLETALRHLFAERL